MNILNKIQEKIEKKKLKILGRSYSSYYIKRKYRKIFEEDLDVNNPKTFTEKLFARMYWVNEFGNDCFTSLADKISVRDYVEKKIGAQYLIPLLWVGENSDQIPFEKISKKVILKTNNGSGGNFVLDENVDKQKIIKKINKYLNINYYWNEAEYHYFKIPPRILIEDFLDDDSLDGPLDYRFWCFHGEPYMVQVDNNKHSINEFYNIDWERMDIRYRKNCQVVTLKKPDNFLLMVELARKLSKNFDFVRVDFYNIKGKIYFGEMTFTPVAGRILFCPRKWDKILGEKWFFRKENQIEYKKS